MVRYIGIFILASSLSAYGALLSSSVKASNNLRKEIISLLKSIESGIKYNNISVIKIISDCSMPMLNKCGFCNSYTGAESAAVVVNNTLGSLSIKDRQMLTEYFSIVGKSNSREQELKQCRYYTEYFEKTQADSEKEVTAKISLYKKLGLLTGILSAIILI